MFHHKDHAPQKESLKEKSKEEPKPGVENKTDAPPILKPKHEYDNASIGELLEKNLKWSQIIYEQNRKIGRKMLWMSIASWFKIIVVAVMLIAGLVFLPPLLGGVLGQYKTLLDTVSGGGNATSQSTNSIDQLLQMLPLTSSQQAQVKALIK